MLYVSERSEWKEKKNSWRAIGRAEGDSELGLADRSPNDCTLVTQSVCFRPGLSIFVLSMSYV